MTMIHEPSQPSERGLSREDLERDREFEALLDELVAAAPRPDLSADFAARLTAERPFAPWEVRRAWAWRLPVVTGAGLVGASAGLFLAPVWRLGPAIAMELWAKLTSAALASPLHAALAAGPLLVEAAGKVSAAAGPNIVLLGAGAALAAGTLVFGMGRPASESLRRASSR
jgi:hypothetical protein